MWSNHIFESKNDFHPDDQISTRAIFASFWPFTMIYGAKDIYFSWKNHWATFGQHLGNICCLNVALNITRKIHFCDFFDVITPLRQHLGNKCCLNVDQMLIFKFFIKFRYFLHQKPFIFLKLADLAQAQVNGKTFNSGGCDSWGPLEQFPKTLLIASICSRMLTFHT